VARITASGAVRAVAEPIWVPTYDDIASAYLTAFASNAARSHGFRGGDYLDLWRWSVDHIDDFWRAIWKFFGIVSPTDFHAGHRGTMPDVSWFDGAQVSYVAHLFRNRSPESVALVDIAESTEQRFRTREITWAQLRAEIAAVAAEFRGLGVGPGARIVAYVPNTAEAVIGFLAAASLGAVWAACGQDYAPTAAAQRFAQLQPTVLVAADGYRYGGRDHDRREAVNELRAALPTVQATLMFGRLSGPQRVWSDGVISWPTPRADQQLSPLDVPFDHPLWVLFSSGTTGRPKGIVHSTGGVLLEHLKALSLALDLGPGDTFFWYTSPSWMVWNYLVSGLLVGARIVCFDGSPTHPSFDTLWSIASEHRVTLLGTSPAYLRACEAAGIEPAMTYDLSALRSIGSSGSLLPAAAYRYVARHVGERIRVNSTSGGTDVVSSFAGSAPTVPVWAGELSAPSLGVALDAWDELGRSVRDTVGELVITKPMPSMPLRFWGDDDGSRYREAYFDSYPGVWRHGDWVTITQRNSVVVHGRSDATLNRNGVRIGSSEIYRALDPLAEVTESLVVGVERDDGGYWMPLFVALNDGVVLDDTLRAAIKAAIREGASPRHLPDDIIEVAAVPHTLTGKKLEIPVKRILLGQRVEDVVDLGGVDRPDVLLDLAALAPVHGAR
jgi:acetoacetyl-CoA synthetase